MFLHVSSEFCPRNDTLLEFRPISTKGGDVAAVFNTCQANCILLTSLIFFVPAFLVRIRKDCKQDDAPQAYMPLIRMSNSLTSQFHNTDTDGNFYLRLPSGEYYFLLLTMAITIFSWLFMSYGHLFDTRKAKKQHHVTISKLLTLILQCVQWLIAILYLARLHRRNRSPSFYFLKTFFIVQFVLTSVETFLNRADNEIWKKYNIRDAYFVVQCVIILCSLLLTIWSIYSYYDEEGGVSPICCCCGCPCYKITIGEDAGKDLYKTFDTSSYSNIGNGFSRTPRTIKRHISGRATPEKDLWNRFHSVTREVSNDLRLAASPTSSTNGYEDKLLSDTIDRLYQDYCKLKDSKNQEGNELLPQVFMHYNESGFLNFSINDDVGLDTKPAYRKDTRSRSISQVHLSSDKDIDAVTFKRALVSFTFKTVYQIMTENLQMCPIWLSLDNPESTPPVYVSANWQTAKRLVVIIPPNSCKIPGVWSVANIASNGLSYGSMLLLLEQCLEDGDGIIILQPEDQYDMYGRKHVGAGESTNTTKLAADVERIINLANNDEKLSLEKVFHDLSNLHDDKTIQEQARAIRGSFYQNYVHVNDDIHTRRNKVAWDVLIKKSKANSISLLSHRSSYASAIKSYRYALNSLSQDYRLRFCAFMNGTKEDYLGVRSYMNISSSLVVLNDVFIFDSEEKQTPLLTMFQSHSRYTDEDDVVVYRLGKKNNRDDELRLLDYVSDNLHNCILFLEDEYYMWYVKHT